MTPQIYRLELSPAAAVDEQARRCELDVFAYWYGDTPELLAEAYGPYEEQTVFLTVTRDDGYVVGTCRVMTPGPRWPKTLADIALPPWEVDADRCVQLAGIDTTRTWDVATIGVRRELGAEGRQISGALYYGLAHGQRVNECPWMMGIIDHRARSLMAMVGYPLHPLPGTGPQPYMGSTACAPVFCHVPTVVSAQRVTHPQAHRLISEGHGLVDVQLPTDAALDLRLTTSAPEVPIDLRDGAGRDARIDLRDGAGRDARIDLRDGAGRDLRSS